MPGLRDPPAQGTPQIVADIPHRRRRRAVPVRRAELAAPRQVPARDPQGGRRRPDREPGDRDPDDHRCGRPALEEPRPVRGIRRHHPGDGRRLRGAGPRHGRVRPLQDGVARRLLGATLRAKDLSPMLATPGKAFSRKDWVFELKYDGYRLIAARRRGPRDAALSHGSRLTDRYSRDRDRAARAARTRSSSSTARSWCSTRGPPDFQQPAGARAARRPSRSRAPRSSRRRRCIVFDLLAARRPRPARRCRCACARSCSRSSSPALGPLRYAEHVPRARRGAARSGRRARPRGRGREAGGLAVPQRRSRPTG